MSARKTKATRKGLKSARISMHNIRRSLRGRPSPRFDGFVRVHNHRERNLLIRLSDMRLGVIRFTTRGVVFRFWPEDGSEDLIRPFRLPEALLSAAPEPHDEDDTDTTFDRMRADGTVAPRMR